MVYLTEAHPKADWFESMREVLKDIDLSEIHDCEKCRGKIVSITVDLVGIERCGYCGQVVPYSQFIKKKIKEKEEFKR
jgi:hypothetical protein